MSVDSWKTGLSKANSRDRTNAVCSGCGCAKKDLRRKYCLSCGIKNSVVIQERNAERRIALSKYNQSDMGYCRRKVKALKDRCNKKGLAFDLDADWVYSRFIQGCELTGLSFSKGYADRQRMASVDRVDPRKGYTKDNCRLILMALNAMKIDGVDAGMREIAQAFLRSPVLEPEYSI